MKSKIKVEMTIEINQDLNLIEEHIVIQAHNKSLEKLVLGIEQCLKWNFDPDNDWWINSVFEDLEIPDKVLFNKSNTKTNISVKIIK